MEFSKLQRRVFSYGVGALVFWGVVSGLQYCRQAHRPFAKTDPWFTGPPSGSDWETLPKNRVYAVTNDHSLAAAAELKTEAWLPITYEAASLMVDKEIESERGLTPTLVRGVQVSRYQHSVVVKINPNNELWVKSETVSHWPLPMLPRPAVVLLRSPPTKVYVDADVHDNHTEAKN